MSEEIEMLRNFLALQDEFQYKMRLFDNQILYDSQKVPAQYLRLHLGNMFKGTNNFGGFFFQF